MIFVPKLSHIPEQIVYYAWWTLLDLRWSQREDDAYK